MNNKLTERNELMDGYDVERGFRRNRACVLAEQVSCTYRTYQITRPKVGKPVKIYRLGYDNYKSMIQNHPELKVLQLT